MASRTRAGRFEVWSRVDGGAIERHGVAFGLTFEDACKQLSTESLDFWEHFEKGRFRGHKVYPSRAEAAADSADRSTRS